MGRLKAHGMNARHIFTPHKVLGHHTEARVGCLRCARRAQRKHGKHGGTRVGGERSLGARAEQESNNPPKGRQTSPACIRRALLAEVFWYGPTSKSAAAFAGRARPIHAWATIWARFSPASGKNKDLRLAGDDEIRMRRRAKTPAMRGGAAKLVRTPGNEARNTPRPRLKTRVFLSRCCEIPRKKAADCYRMSTECTRNIYSFRSSWLTLARRASCRSPDFRFLLGAPPVDS